MNEKKHIMYIMSLILSVLFLSYCGTNTSITNPDSNDSLGLAFGTESTFDIITWNIENFPKRNPETSTLLLTILPKLKADCIAIQEVNNISAFNNFVSSLPGWSYRISGSGDTQTAILYKNSTVQVDSSATIFHGMSNPFPRAPLLMKIKWQNQEIIIISLHLKAYGDNIINESDPNDEEVRRRYACQLLDQYVSTNFPNAKVIILGDMNDQIQESAISNIFMSFLNKPAEYNFADMPIAQNLSSQNCSYPRYISHLDHILITNELFSAFDATGKYVRTIQIENYIIGGWNSYYQNISDHRPVGARFSFSN